MKAKNEKVHVVTLTTAQLQTAKHLCSDALKSGSGQGSYPGGLGTEDERSITNLELALLRARG